MKKITSEVPVSFRYDGNTLLEIDKDGCLATDEAAAVAKDRLGDQITVTDVVSDKKEDSGDSNTGPTFDELKARAKELGLKQNGKKEEVAARIAEKEALIKEEESAAAKLAEAGKKIATQDDLDADPALVEAGVKVGDEIDLPVK